MSSSSSLIYVNNLVDLPLDTPPPAIDTSTSGVDHTKSLTKTALKSMDSLTTFDAKKPVYVPFKREIKFKTVGPDVLAVKRALSVAGYGKWGAWGSIPRFFGTVARQHLRTFQQQHGLHVDGVYGLNTHKKLSPFFDALGRYEMGQTHIIPSTTLTREKIVSAAMFGYAHAWQIHYTESSERMYGVRNHIVPPAVPVFEDCSSFATWCYWVAGASDPNGLGYNGQGYTGTLASHGRSVSLNDAKPGDLFFYYGTWSVPGHVSIYVGNDREVSHGNEAGPSLIGLGSPMEIRSYI